ncbi:radical SAM protein [Blautia sp. HCP28S3_G10]|uniref:radical SAM protein n=1 Tax=Blautia sp. HCP28S3_G10 TaxID=3438908 RepID=UPI003F8A3C4F
MDKKKCEIMEECRLCPRNCGADRNAGQKGFCGVSAEVKIARAALHMWEEPCISGKEGSGAVFFSGCALRCRFCQNRAISGGQQGKTVPVKRLAEIFLELQEQNANNINLVTAGQFIPQVAEAIILARDQGLKIPVVYNSSGYESLTALKMLEGLVDIYLPDFKYMDPDLAFKYSYAKDYPEVAKEALKEMVRQVGEPEFDDRGMMQRGIIVRHLLLPGHVRDSRNVLKYLIDTYGNRIYISLMNQYTPMPAMKEDPLLSRKVTEREYERLIDYGISLGLENGFIQEGETAIESFIPKFDGEGK